MSRLTLAAQRRVAGFGMFGAFGLSVVWVLSPGLPVMWGPYARASTREAGRELFEHEWAANDPLAHGDGFEGTVGTGAPDARRQAADGVLPAGRGAAREPVIRQR